MRVLTPPYHCAIVACPLPSDGEAAASQILYRGSIPAARNATFVRRLGIKTMVCMRKKPLKETDSFSLWAAKNGINVIWVKADKMGEETLGMDRDQATDVLKILLDPTLYPVYLADVDGTSHTTLVVAALRKLQGWAPDSIEGEVFRFEPDHDDLPLSPFITSYLSTSGPSKDDSAATFCLPGPPYPCWLWPASTDLGARKDQPANGPRNDRSASSASTSSAASTALPFPNPLSARKHPSMRLTFPALAEQPNSTGNKTSRGPPIGAPLSRAITLDRTRTLSPSENLRERDDSLDSRTSQKVSFSDSLRSPVQALTEQSPNDATSTSSRWGGTGTETASPEDSKRELEIEEVEDSDNDDMDDSSLEVSDASLGSAAVEDDDDLDSDEEEDDDDDDDDEDEEDDEDDDEPPVSQYISALDLAGY